MLLRLAWKNIWRNKRRSIITGLSIAFGLWLAIIMVGVQNYFYSKMIDNGATMGYGHVSVLPNEYMKFPSTKKTITNIDKIYIALKKNKKVKQYVTRIMGQAMIATATNSIGAMFIAINPQKENKDTNLFIKSIKKGKLFPNSKKPQCLIGASLAKKLGLSLGKKLVLTTTDKNNEISSALFKVSGIFKTGAPEIDDYFVVIPIDKTKRILKYYANEATLVAIQLFDHRDSKSVTDYLSKALPFNYDILTWKKTQPDLAGLIALDKVSGRVFVFMIGLIIVLGILNTILMSVMERKREFGIMLAIGTSPKVLVKLIMLESLVLGFIGTILGAIITVPSYLYFLYVGLDMRVYMKETSTAGGVIFDPILRVMLYPNNLVIIIALIISLTVFASIYPAIKAAKVSPIKSIRTL